MWEIFHKLWGIERKDSGKGAFLDRKEPFSRTTVNNVRSASEVCYDLSKKTLGRHHSHCSGVFIENFKRIPHCPSILIVEFKLDFSDELLEVATKY